MVKGIAKAVITAAGLGTRLLTVTKELPKEMMPIFVEENTSRGRVPMVKPLLQLIFEQLYYIGIREFCFVVGRGKRAIEDHFTPDNRYVALLRSRGNGLAAVILEEFYSKVRDSSIVWVNQEEPLGFGDAVLRARKFVGSDDFLVAAGDTYIISDHNSHLRRLLDAHLGSGGDATIMLRAVEDPRHFGVAVLDGDRVVRVVEKPSSPPTNLAIMPFYVFSPTIMEGLKRVEPDGRGEVQLTSAIQWMIESGKEVRAVVLGDGDEWIDVGTPELYRRAICRSFRANEGEPMRGER